MPCFTPSRNLNRPERSANGSRRPRRGSRLSLARRSSPWTPSRKRRMRRGGWAGAEKNRGRRVLECNPLKRNECNLLGTEEGTQSEKWEYTKRGGRWKLKRTPDISCEWRGDATRRVSRQFYSKGWKLRCFNPDIAYTQTDSRLRRVRQGYFRRQASRVSLVNEFGCQVSFPASCLELSCLYYYAFPPPFEYLFNSILLRSLSRLNLWDIKFFR